MLWTPLEFGRHAEKTLPQILFCNPDWFFWAMDEQLFHPRTVLGQQAEELDYKARHIRIPAREGPPLVAQYVFTPQRKFSHLWLVPSTAPYPDGSNVILRWSVIDLSIPRQQGGPYDKKGYRRLVQELRYLFFGKRNAKLTCQRCAAFYEDPSHFVVPRD